MSSQGVDIWSEIAAAASEPPTPPPKRKKRQPEKQAAPDIWSEIAEAAGSAEAPPPSGIEAFARGGIQGASAGFSDEIAGAAKAIGVDPKEFAAAISQGPVGIATYIGSKIGKSYGGDTGGARTEKYTAGRDAERAANERAQEANPMTYLGGQVVGGVAGAATGAPLTAVGSVVAGAGYGAAASLGESEADLTRGEFRQAAEDTGKGALVGGLAGGAGHLVSRGIEAARGLATRLSKDKMITNLGQYLDGIVRRGGDPKLVKQAAGKVMQTAIDQAGDTRVPMGKLGELAADMAKLPQNRRHKVVDDVMESAERFREGGATLGEMHAELKHWGQLAKDLGKSDPAGARFAKQAREALRSEIEAIDPKIAGAADYLVGRADYAKAAAADDVLAKLKNAVDPLSAGGEGLSPRKFAALNSGARKKEIEGWFAKDPEALEAWRMGAEAARVLAKRGERWIPKAIRDQLPEPALRAADALMTSFDVTRAFTDPDTARDFARLVLPGRPVQAEEALTIISRLSARMHDDERAVATARGAIEPGAEPRPYARLTR